MEIGIALLSSWRVVISTRMTPPMPKSFARKRPVSLTQRDSGLTCRDREAGKLRGWGFGVEIRDGDFGRGLVRHGFRTIQASTPRNAKLLSGKVKRLMQHGVVSTTG